jgi:putative transposase
MNQNAYTTRRSARSRVMTEHLAAVYRERTPSRRGERNGHYARGLITPAGRIAQLRVPRDREGAFLAELFARYKRTTG